ncbi:MAG: HD domain-containing protein [Candidatus Saccharimonadaceae bacterium]
MQPLLSATSFTPEHILGNDFINALPEYYTLNDIVESQDWHNEQTVFDHSIKCATELEEITKFAFLPVQEREQIVAYLNGKVELHTRLELLRLATLLHDIGKHVSLHHNAQGNTASPSHGLLGEWIARPVVDKFDVTDNEKNFVLGLISDHLVPSDLIEMSINNHTPYQNVVMLLQENRPDTMVELLLLAYADWLGCDIRAVVREEREVRIGIVHECLSLITQRVKGLV